jgi:predicted amidophosphoribosyltransferase
MDVDLTQLPIPDWGLTCPGCGYLLRGLPTHRCPECGEPIAVEELVRCWTRLRAPRFTGHESPLPDLGLRCPTCGEPLAGAVGSACGHCGAGFQIEGWQPRGAWFIVDSELCGRLPIPGVQALLAGEGVPYFPMTEMTVGDIYGGRSMMVARLRVPSEFYFEVRWLLENARRDVEAARAGEQKQWRCAHCGEVNPGHFEVCWNCERANDA